MPDTPSGTPAPRPGTKAAAAAARQAKVEQFKREAAKKARTRRIVGWSLGGVAVVAVAGLIAGVVITGTQANTIEGLETYKNTAEHVTGAVDYPQTPPAGGPHNQVWLNCGVYTEPVPNENAVHDLEHGAVWATYDPSLPQDEIDALVAALPDTYVTVSPFEGLDSPIVLSAWNAQVAVDSPDDERVAKFVKRFWQSGTAPELGAPCTGGIDAPGKV